MHQQPMRANLDRGKCCNLDGILRNQPTNGIRVQQFVHDEQLRDALNAAVERARSFEYRHAVSIQVSHKRAVARRKADAAKIARVNRVLRTGLSTKWAVGGEDAPLLSYMSSDRYGAISVITRHEARIAPSEQQVSANTQQREIVYAEYLDEQRALNFISQFRLDSHSRCHVSSLV